MMRLPKYLFAVLLMASSWTLRAQEAEPDSLRVPGGQSIMSLKMQRRYVPVNSPFLEDKSLLANSFVTLVGSGYRQLADNYSNGPYLTLGAGKWLRMAHGVRVSLGAGYFFDNYDWRRVRMMDLRADYLFNLSAYVDGYNPYRRIEVHTLAGLGMSMYYPQGKRLLVAPSAHLGLDLSIRIFPGADLLIEPLFELAKDPRMLPRMDIWRGYVPAYHIGVGGRYYLDRRNWGEDPGEDLFFSVSGGFQFQNSELRQRIPFFSSLGSYVCAGVGRYYTDILSFRLHLAYGSHYWKEIFEGDTDVYGYPLQPGRFKSSYYCVRLDGIVNLLPLMVKEPSRLSLSLLAGPEVGILDKKDPDKGDIRYFYVGASAGLQFKCRVYQGLSVYLEPRVSYVPYAAYAFSSATEYRNYYDAVLGFSLGVEYRLGMRKEKK